MRKTKYLLLLLAFNLVACAQIKEEDDFADAAAAELNKMSLYQSEYGPAPQYPQLPSEYLQLGENLLINGSFESPVLGTQWAVLPNSDVPGWHGTWVDASCAAPVQIELQSKELYALVPDLNQYTELDAENACSADARLTLAQTSYTVPNHIYRLSFWMRARDAEHEMGLKVAIGETQTFDYTPTVDGWQVVTVNFEATSSTTTLSFTDTGAGDTYGTFLDAVSVTEVTVNTEAMPKPPGRKGRHGGKPKQSFEGGRRHKDCHRHG
jgi:hypothetical protein